MKGSPTTRRHDSCYYEINNGATQSQIALLNKTSGEEGGARIYIQITKGTNMNVYLYGGMNRESATQMMIPGNA
jgi:hypothetical protein